MTGVRSPRRAAAAGLLALQVATLGACAHTYEQLRTGAAPTAAPVLARDAPIYIAVPADGHYGSIEYRGSGRMTALALETAFSRHAVRVAVADAVAPADHAVAEARRQGFPWVVYPAILHWEDRATEWSGKPDRITVKITLIDSATGQVRDEVMIKGTSRWFTFGGDHPQDLLPEPVEAFVGRLYGVASAPK